MEQYEICLDDRYVQVVCDTGPQDSDPPEPAATTV